MKTMRSLRGMTVIIAAVILVATIFAIPVPSANAADTMPQQPGESATLIINSNGTPNNFSDDFIEDVLWSDCTKAD